MRFQSHHQVAAEALPWLPRPPRQEAQAKVTFTGPAGWKQPQHTSAEGLASAVGLAMQSSGQPTLIPGSGVQRRRPTERHRKSHREPVALLYNEQFLFHVLVCKIM